VGDGVVLEQGTHHELLADPNSKYSEMWKDYLRHKDEGYSDLEEEEINEIKKTIEHK
jgi:hypothetical protein